MFKPDINLPLNIKRNKPNNNLLTNIKNSSVSLLEWLGIDLQRGDADKFLNQRGQWSEAGGNSWDLQGNTGTDPNTDFIGTTDAQDVVFKRNNIAVGRFARNAPGAQNRFYVGGDTTTDVPLEVRWDDATTFGLVLKSKDTNKIEFNGDLITITSESLLLSNIRTYVDDVAADADTGLPSGALYKLTGNRTIFQKP